MTMPLYKLILQKRRRYCTTLCVAVVLFLQAAAVHAIKPVYEGKATPSATPLSAGGFVLRGGLKPEKATTARQRIGGVAVPPPVEPVQQTEPLVVSTAAPSEAYTAAPGGAYPGEAYPEEPRSSWGGAIVVLGALLLAGFILRRLSHWFDH